MRIIDPNFRRHVGRYVLQCLLATATVMVLLAVMDAVEHTVMVASLGASTFIVFTTPKAKEGSTRHLLGGYAVGIAVGTAFALVHTWLTFQKGSGAEQVAVVTFGGLAVGMAIFLMVVTNTEHPPAAGVALGLVIGQNWNVTTLLGILGVILGLALLKRMLRRFLIDLL